MPKLKLGVPHTLGQEEATRRLKARFGELKNRFGGQISDLEEAWDGDLMTFGFKAMGMAIRGVVASESSEVNVKADLPLAAMMFKGTIEQQMRDELGKILTS